MPYLLLGLAALTLTLLAARWFINAPAGQLAYRVRLIAAWGALAGAFLLAITGRFPLAVPLAGLSFMLFTRAGIFGGSRPSPGQTSRVRTEWLEMELDHESGAMRGQVLQGVFEGRMLDDLSQSDLLTLLEECLAADHQSAQLLEAYLDREHVGWRGGAHSGEQERGHGNSGQGGARPDATGGAMTRDQAYEILGLQPGASQDDIRKAHRTLMKRVHPDRGGSTYLASKINEAKDLLLDHDD